MAKHLPGNDSQYSVQKLSTKSRFFLNSLPQDGDLLLYLHPENILVQVIVVTVAVPIVTHCVEIVMSINAHPLVIAVAAMLGAHSSMTLVVRLPCDGQEGRNERFLHISEAELVGDLGDWLAQLVGELDVVVLAQLLLPEVAIGDALLQVGVGEEVLPVEARRALLLWALVSCKHCAGVIKGSLPRYQDPNGRGG
jgi:hypothetical protein